MFPFSFPFFCFVFNRIQRLSCFGFIQSGENLNVTHVTRVPLYLLESHEINTPVFAAIYPLDTEKRHMMLYWHSFIRIKMSQNLSSNPIYIHWLLLRTWILPQLQRQWPTTEISRSQFLRRIFDLIAQREQSQKQQFPRHQAFAK